MAAGHGGRLENEMREALLARLIEAQYCP